MHQPGYCSMQSRAPRDARAAQQVLQQHREGEVCEWVAVRERGAYHFVRVKVPRDDSMTTVEQLQHRNSRMKEVVLRAVLNAQL